MFENFNQAYSVTLNHDITTNSNFYMKGYLNSSVTPSYEIDYNKYDKLGYQIDPNYAPLDPRFNLTTATIENVDIPSVMQIIEDFRRDTETPYSSILADRLYLLNEYASEEYSDESELMSINSLMDFQQFFKNNIELSFPSVTLTSEGHVWIQWQPSINQHFSVEFIGEGKVSFVVFAPDSYIKSQINRVSGKSTIYSLMDHVKGYNVSDWITIKAKVA